MSEQPVSRPDQTLNDSQLPQPTPSPPVSLDTPRGAGAPETIHPSQWQDAPAPVQRLGRFEIQGEIGRGGMGAVLRGRDPALGRDLALKVLLANQTENADVVRRFHEEAQIGGQLQHPGLVPVYELGADSEGRPFFAMKLVKGRTLAALLQERQSPADDLPRLLTIFEQICQTLAYAHDRRVIHRDLKPANVMVGAFGEVQVMDWGLAKVLTEALVPSPSAERGSTPAQSRIRTESDGSASRAGTVLGTPAYMPPEQARGETDLLDQRADVFGLGAILCEILTGRPPFIGRNANEVLARAGRGDLAEAVKRLDECGADRELAQLAKACLAPEVDGRPRDGSAVAGQVAAYRAGVAERLRTAELERAAAEVRAVEERKRANLERAAARVVEERKRAILEREKRRRTQALAAAVFLLLLGAGGGGWWWQQQRAQTVAREREAEQRIRLALQDARDRLDEAKRTGKMELYPEAKASLDKASEVARTSQVGGSIQGEIDALENRRQTEFATANKGRRLLIACLEVRQPREVNRYEKNDSGLMSALAEPSVDEQFALAFRAWDTEFDVAKPNEALKCLQSLPEPVVQELVAALDEWWQTRREAKPPGDWRMLHDLAERLDANERRRELRCLLASGELEREWRAANVAAAAWPMSGMLRMGRGGLDEVLGATALTGPPTSRKVAQAVGRNRTRLRELAGRIDSRNESMLTVLALSRALSRSGEERSAEEVLGTALTARPGEVALLMAMGELLERQQPPRLDRAIECYRAARAIRSEFGVSLGKGLNAADRSDEGEAVLRELLRGQQDHPELHFYLGNALNYKKQLSAAVAEWRAAIRLKPDFPTAHNNLGVALQDQGKLPEAVVEFREAIRLEPDLSQAHFNLGRVLKAQGQVTEAVASYREAIRLAPDDCLAHAGLGIALNDQGMILEAIAANREAIRLKPDYAEAHSNLGNALQAQGKLPEAIAAYREAIRLKPEMPEAHSNLGNILRIQGKQVEAERAYREAIRLKSDYPEAYNNLGAVLFELGRHPEAIDSFREAIRLKHDLPHAYSNLGGVLLAQGNFSEGEVACREAIQVAPGISDGYVHLGIALRARGKFSEAEVVLRQVIRLKSDYPLAHYTLGKCFQDQGKVTEAVASYRESIRLNPDYPEAHCNLGSALRQQGQFEASLAEFRCGHELGLKLSGWRYPSAQWVRKAERLVELDLRLPDLLAGKAKPTNAAEQVEFAEFCGASKHQYLAAVRFYAGAFQAEPNLANDLVKGHRYNAACAAALAAAGKDEEAKKIDEPERARLRSQTLGWLREDLAAWGKRLDGSKPTDLALVAGKMHHWQQDADLATVRDAIDQLPATERAAWRQLWQDVEALRKRATESK